MTDLPLTSFTTLLEEEAEKQCDMWHLTLDTWNLTHGMLHMTGRGRWTFSQNFSSLASTVWEWRCFEDVLKMPSPFNTTHEYQTDVTCVLHMCHVHTHVSYIETGWVCTIGSTGIFPACGRRDTDSCVPPTALVTSLYTVQTFGLLQWSLDLALSDFTGGKLEYAQC